MGTFLAVSAVRDVSVEQIAQSIAQFAKLHAVAAELVNADSNDQSAEPDAWIFDPFNRWTVILWPQYFGGHDRAACQHITRELGTLACTVHVYDGDYWAHALFDAGEWVDRFCSEPNYHSEDETSASARTLRDQWRGDPTAYSTRLGVESTAISGYFVQCPYYPDADEELSDDQRERLLNDLPRVAPDDLFALCDFWVFTDLWRRLGIEYPEDPGAWRTGVRFAVGFLKRLPDLGDL